MKKKKTDRKVLLRRVLLILFGAALGLNVYMINANSIVGEQLPTPFGFGAAVVLSGSMEPELSTGDLIIVKETDDFEVNDVVVYQDGIGLVVHRIVDIEGDTVITKGDANNAADQPIDRTAVKGTVSFSVPFAGNIVTFLKSKIGTVCIIIAIIALVELSRRRERQEYDEERQKIIDEINRLRREEE